MFDTLHPTTFASALVRLHPPAIPKRATRSVVFPPPSCPFCTTDTNVVTRSVDNGTVVFNQIRSGAHLLAVPYLIDMLTAVRSLVAAVVPKLVRSARSRLCLWTDIDKKEFVFLSPDSL